MSDENGERERLERATDYVAKVLSKTKRVSLMDAPGEPAGAFERAICRKADETGLVQAECLVPCAECMRTRNPFRKVAK